jgi:hypothetical protein
MYCRTIENFTTNITTIDDVTSQGDKNIMLTDANGNLSVVKFSDTVIRLQNMIKALNDTVIFQSNRIDQQATEIAELTSVQETKLTQTEVDARVIKGFGKLIWSRSRSNPAGGRNRVFGVSGAIDDVFKDRGGSDLFLYKPTDLS